MKFFLLARGEVVGWSPLPLIDVGMNVVRGPFYPNKNYANIQPDILEHHQHLHNGSLEPHNPCELERARQQIRMLDLHLLCENGEILRPEPGGSIHLEDFSQELKEDPFELNVLGLPRELVKKFWPRECDAF
jgi:hypothetical protein